MKILRKVKKYRSILGLQTYLVIVLVVLATFAESIGFISFIPIFEYDFDQQYEADDAQSKIIDFLELVGIERSIESLILATSVLFLCKGILIFLSLRMSSVLRAKLQYLLRSKLSVAIFSLNVRAYQRLSTSHYVSLLNEHVNRAVQSFYFLMHTCSQVSAAIIYLAVAFFLSWKITIFVCVLGCILVTAFRFLNYRLQLMAKEVSSAMGELNHLSIQGTQSFLYLHVVAKKKIFLEKILQVSERLRDLQRRTWIYGAFTQSIREPIAIVVLLSVLAMSVIFLGEEKFDTLILLGLMYKLVNSIVNAQHFWQQCVEYYGSTQKIFDQLDVEGQSDGLQEQLSQTVAEFGELKFDQVGLTIEGYDKQLFSDISFTLRHGETLSIIGPSGSGKSTLLLLMAEIIEPDDGTIKWLDRDGVARDFLDFRNSVGFLNQDAMLFDGTIKDNLTFWAKSDEPHTTDRIQAACQLAGIATFVESLPQGYETQITEQGANLSGGQRQRLCLARELYRRPKILLLDEVTSALDPDSEKMIKRTLEQLNGEITVILITHSNDVIPERSKILSLY